MLRLKFILHWLWTTSLKLATLSILLMSGSILWAVTVFFWQSNAELSAAHGVLQQNSESEFMAIGSFMQGISYLTMIVTGATFVFHFRDFIFAYTEKFKTKTSTNQATFNTNPNKEAA
jgi:hypothetical protein